jgi:hypothetical protein
VEAEDIHRNNAMRRIKKPILLLALFPQISSVSTNFLGLLKYWSEKRKGAGAKEANPDRRASRN